MIPCPPVRLDHITEHDLPVTVDRYTLTALLGEGGMARVFRAQMDGALGFKKPAAVKVVLRGSGEKGDTLRKQLVQEARLGGLLNHPNVVQTFDCGELGGFPFIAMELVEGVGLSDLIESTGALPATAVLDVAIQVARGLHHAHTATHEGQPLQIIHRDIKPSNILVRQDGVVKVMDFGIAKVSMSDALATESGTTKGTPSYMSPEQLAGKGMDARTDLFALGAVIFAMLTGRTLFTGGSVTEVMMRIIQVNDWVRGQKVDVVADAAVTGLSAVVLALLEHDIDDRPTSAAMVASELERLRRQLPGDNVLADLVAKTMADRAAKAPPPSTPGSVWTETRDAAAEAGPGRPAQLRGDRTRAMRSGPQFAATEAVPSGPRGTKSRAPILAPTQAVAELDEDDGGDEVDAEPLSTQTRGTMRKRKAAPKASAAPWVLGAGFGILGFAILAFLLMGRGAPKDGAPASLPEPTASAQATPSVAPPPPDLSLSQPASETTPAPTAPAPAPAPAVRPTPPPGPVKVVVAPNPSPAPATPAPTVESTPRPDPPPSPRLTTLSIQHTPVSRATAGTSRGITATIEGAAEARVTIHFGPPGGPHSSIDAAPVSGGVYRGSIPIPATGALEYWIEAESDGASARSGSKSKPYRIAVF